MKYMFLSKNSRLAVSLAFCLLAASSTRAQIIKTIAGNNTAGFSGDGGAATAANLHYPGGVAVDASGNVYIADITNGRIRKVSASGIITTVAGSGATDGTGAYSGDGGPATAAKFYGPVDVARDGAGNLYVADIFNQRVRKISATGSITTFAGNGTAGYSGDGGAATAAKLNYPATVAVDRAGNVYIGDESNHCIRKVTTSGVITTVAGTGTAGFTGDGGPATAARISGVKLAVDLSGNLYIGTDYRIRKVDTSGIISTVAGNGSNYGGYGGPATNAGFTPSGIAVDSMGNIYIAEGLNSCILRVNATSHVISEVVGVMGGTGGYSGDGGAASAALLNSPVGLTIDPSGNLYIADYGNHVVRKVYNIYHAPSFFASSYSLSFCANTVNQIRSALNARDAFVGQALTWSLASGPLHGSASVAFTTISTGGTISPSGFTYTPTPGYVGYDMFVVRISDGISASSITINVNVDASPEIAVISGPTSVCVGAAISLVSSASTGTWAAANGTASVSSTGVVRGVNGLFSNVIYFTTTSAHCGTHRSSYPITVNRVPGVYPIAGTSSVAVGNSITLMDYTPGGTWATSAPSVASVDTSGTVNGVTVGSTTISYTVTNACGTASSTRNISVTAHRGANNTGNNLTGNNAYLSIYPNPSDGSFVVNVTAAINEDAQVIVTNMIGEKMGEFNITTNQPAEETIQLPTGIYLITAITKNDRLTTKIVVAN